MPDFNLTYAMNVNQLSSLQSLLDKGVSQSLLVKNGNTYSMPYSDEGALMFDKDKLVFSNQKTTAQAFMENKGNAKEGLPADVWKNIVNNPITMYANIKKMMSVIPMEATSEIEKQLLADLQSMFTYAQIYGGKMKGNANHLEGNLYFSNKEENAMIQLINLGIKMKKEQDSRNKNIIADTLAV
jgi:hypothetical protein